jgi:hypothetical protein
MAQSDDIGFQPSGDAGQVIPSDEHVTVPSQYDLTSSEMADRIDKHLASGDGQTFCDAGAASLLGSGQTRGLLLSERGQSISRRVRNGLGTLPPSHPSNDLLTKSLLQRDFSMDGIPIGRDFSTDMLGRRLRSRDPSFENGGLGQQHREMSMSIEFSRPLRSHLSMEMQLTASRSGLGLQQGNLIDDLGLGAAAGDPTACELTSSFSTLFTNVDGMWVPETGFGSGAAQFGVAGHISRSYRGRSKDDLMLDLRGGSNTERDRFVRFPNSGTFEDVRDAKHPF